METQKLLEELEKDLSKMNELEKKILQRVMIRRYFIKNPVKPEKIIPFNLGK